MMRKVGAPAGGRVHWLLWNLPPRLSTVYRVHMDYLYHNYLFIRQLDRRRMPRDLFIVVRTSRKCWRCMYFHFEYNYFEYFSERTSKKLVAHMERVYDKIRKSEERYENAKI